MNSDIKALVRKLRNTEFDKDNMPRMKSERWFPVGLALEAADALTLLEQERDALREALTKLKGEAMDP